MTPGTVREACGAGRWYFFDGAELAPVDVQRLQHPESRGHMFYMGALEYFDRGGQVMTAPIDRPLGDDGYRPGTWHSTRRRFDDYRASLRQRLDDYRPEAT